MSEAFEYAATLYNASEKVPPEVMQQAGIISGPESIILVRDRLVVHTARLEAMARLIDDAIQTGLVNEDLLHQLGGYLV